MSLHRRRAHPRYAVEQAFVVTGSPERGSAALEGPLLNVSLGGLAFRCDEAPPIGAALQLAIAHPGGNVAVDVRGCVIATSPHAHGGSVAHCTFLVPCRAEQLLEPLGIPTGSPA